MAVRLFVGNLGPVISDQELAAMFAPYGAVKAEVVRGRRGKGRGFGYIELLSEQEATRAIADLNGREVGGRPITLAGANASPRKSPDEVDQQYGYSRSSGGRSRSGGGGGGGYRR